MHRQPVEPPRCLEAIPQRPVAVEHGRLFSCPAIIGHESATPAPPAVEMANYPSQAFVDDLSAVGIVCAYSSRRASAKYQRVQLVLVTRFGFCLLMAATGGPHVMALAHGGCCPLHGLRKHQCCDQQTGLLLSPWPGQAEFQSRERSATATAGKATDQVSGLQDRHRQNRNGYTRLRADPAATR